MRPLSEDEIRVLSSMRSSLGTKIPCAIYARKSKEDRSQEALSVQVDVCQKIIDSNSELLHLTKVYQEDEASGKNIEDRKEFSKLLQAVDDGFIKVILVSKWDRMARNTQDTITLRNSLPAQGAFIIAVEDTGRQDAVSTLMRDIMASIAQFYIQKISEDTKSVLIKKTSTGQTGGGRANYGYEVYKNAIGEKRLRQNPIEAPVVREIFDRFVAGWSFEDIIKSLKKRNIKTRDGNNFTRSFLSSILRNVKYYGVYRYNRQDRKQNPISAKHFDEVWVEDGIEDPIVSEQTFKVVQTMLDSNLSGKNKHNYLLTGLLECESCGANYIGSSQSRGSGKPRKKYYVCSNSQGSKGSTCSNKGLEAETIEEYVADTVYKYMVKFARSKHYDSKQFDTLDDREKARLKSIQTSIKNYEKTKKQLLDRLLDDPEEKMAKVIEERITQTQSEIDLLEESAKNLKLETNIIQANKESFRSGKFSKDQLFANEENKRRIVHGVIQKIIVGDEIQIHIDEKEEPS